jgi:hypothetical protein
MTLVRLAVPALFLSSLPCFAQAQAYAVEPSHARAAFSQLKTRDFSEFNRSDSWSIAPRPSIDLSSRMEVLEDGGVTKARSEVEFRSLRESRDCLSIRSYLMARENKNSDATYLKASSVCQPASHYQLKSATERAVSPDR